MTHVKKHELGFTLVEMMIVLVILGLVSIGAITAITGQSKVYHSEEDLVEMQMNAKVAMDRIRYLLRMAGVGCIDSFGANLTDGNLPTYDDTDTEVAPNPTTSLFIINDDTPPGSDRLTLVAAVRYIGTISAVPADNQITLTNVPSHTLNERVTSTAPKNCIFISPQDANRYETISAINGSTLTLTSAILPRERKEELSRALAAGVHNQVYQVQAFTIRVVNGSLRIDENISQTSTQLDVADNIECLQFEYGIDTDSPADGQIDNWVNNPATIKQIKAIRIFLLTRTGKQDREYVDRKTYTLAGTTLGPYNDNFHRLLLESTITIRNRNF
jgi:prepilin-type N-terminal cleavage/methylation domain-containing protein